VAVVIVVLAGFTVIALISTDIVRVIRGEGRGNVEEGRGPDH
jgi:hypothetical protein